MAEFKVLEIDNSKKAAIQTGKWKAPDAAFYDQLMNAVHCKGEIPADKDELDAKIKNGDYKQWPDLLKEAYLVAPVKNIKGSPHGVTPYSRSGCKYPHHVIKGNKLVVSVPGLRAAYICARNQGCFDSDPNKRPEYSRTLVAHLNRHCKELGLKAVWHHGEFYLMNESDERIAQNFHDINLFIMERTGINLFEEDVLTEASHGNLKIDHRLAIDAETGHSIHIIYSLDNMKLLQYKDGRKVKDANDEAKRIAHLKRFGNTDHQSCNQKVLAIYDMETGKKLQQVTIRPPFVTSGPTTTITVGTIDTVPSFKSTFWNPNQKDQNVMNHEVYSGKIRGHVGYNLDKYGSLRVPTEIKHPEYSKSELNILDEIRFYQQAILDAKASGNKRKYDKAVEEYKYHTERLRKARERRKAESVTSHISEFTEAVIEGPPNAPVLSSDFTKEVGAATPQALWEWMHKNIQYDKNNANWKLRTAAELYIDKKGNCHDQSYFAAFILHSWHYDNWQLYFVEFKDSSEQGGNSHTLTYYLDGGKYYWFENAWEDQAGIHGPYDSKEDIKQAVMDAYAHDYDLNSHEFDGIVFGENPNYRLGMNLRDYCNSWHLSDDRRFTKGTPVINANATKTTNPNDPESQEAVDIKFTNEDGEEIGEASVSAVDTDHGFLYNVEVFSGYRGKGYGKAIIEYCLSHYKITELTVEPTNTIAIQLYEQYGFKKYMDWEEHGRKLIDMRRDNMKAIHEAAEWIENFVHDEEFRESAGINSVSDLVKNCPTPNDLMKWMRCIKYAFLDKNGKEITDDEKWYDEYRHQSPLQVIRRKKGVCWDCTGLARQWFERSKYPFCEVYLEIVDDEDCPSHTFIIFKDPGESEQVSWFESSWGAKKGIHPYGDLETCMNSVVDEFLKSHDADPKNTKLICRSINKGMKFGCTMQEYMDFAHNSFPIDLGDLFYDEIFNESYISEGAIPHQDYTFENLPNELYFSSPFKIKELKGRVFMSPYAGISSIFIVDHFKILKECAEKEFGHKPTRNSVNISYKEWNYEVEDLQHPLKTVHMNHNIPELKGKYHGSSSGYIYKVDISDVRDKLSKHGSHSLDHEVIYTGDRPLKILEVKPHTIKWELEFSEENMKHNGKGFIESSDIFDPEGIHWSSRMFMEAEEEERPLEDQPIDDDPPPSLDEPEPAEPAAEEEDGPKEGDELDAPVPEPVSEPTEEVSEEQPEELVVEEPPVEETPKTEPPKKESMPKQADREESDKNGVRRKKLYITFIEWCKEYNNKNAFGSIFDKDAFKVSYPFVPDEMRYFYRLANPMLCILSGNLTFFPVAELRKINSQNKKLDEVMIFAGTEKDFRVFNVKDKGIYIATEENDEVKLGSKLAETFDLYIQNMIDKGDILNGPIEESVEDVWFD